jgi:hypothetical protein
MTNATRPPLDATWTTEDNKVMLAIHHGRRVLARLSSFREDKVVEEIIHSLITLNSCEKPKFGCEQSAEW